MRELQPASDPSTHPVRSFAGHGRVRFRLSRTAFALSILVHAAAGYALSRQMWPSTAPPPSSAEFFLFEAPQPRPAEAVPAPVPPPEVRPEVEPAPQPAVAPLPPPRAAEIVEPLGIIVGEPPAEEAPPRRMPTLEELDEARQRAARDVVTEQADKKGYLTFSIDDVAPPRPAPEPEPERSIFDPSPGTRGPSVGTVGQSRTKLGHRMSELCNALTGGGFSLMGFGSFCAKPNEEPTGLFPEVMPAYLKMMPDCVDTRDTAPALALEAPFPTIKCRMVDIDELAELRATP